MNRRGLAAVEFVMVIPLLLVLIMGLIWTGRVSIARATTAVAARCDAWNARQGVRHQTFDFYDTTSGIATTSAEQTVAILRPAVSTAPQATASVHGDPWGFRTVGMNKPPNWQLMTRALRAAGENRAEQVSGIIDRLRSALEKLLTIKGVLSGLTDQISAFDTQLGDAKTEAAKDLLAKSGGDIDKAIEEARTNIDKLRKVVIPELEHQVDELPPGVDDMVKTVLKQAQGMLKGYEVALKTLEELKRRPPP